MPRCETIPVTGLLDVRVNLVPATLGQHAGHHGGVFPQGPLEIVHRRLPSYAVAVDYRIEPVAWDVIYPVQSTPIGGIQLEAGEYVAALGDEELGRYATGDDAATAVWDRFREQAHARHAEASVMHGGRERHRHG